MLIFFLFSVSFNTTSTRISSYTSSNPAFTAYFGDYEFYLEYRDIGDIDFFNLSTKFKYWGLGFSSADNEYDNITEKKNWLSISNHLINAPISLGINLGIIKVWDNTNTLFDMGIWFRHSLSFGFCGLNLLNDDRTVRFGASYNWRKITGIVEIEDSIRYRHFIPHLLVEFKQPIGDFNIKFRGGYHSKKLTTGIEIEFRGFIRSSLVFEKITKLQKLQIGANFSPPVIIKEETLLVEQPMIIKKTVYRKEPKDKKTKILEKGDEKYCEVHYLKGIEYYLNNKLKEAIQEWNLTIKVCPDYKDITRYLENAREKLKLLEE